MLIVNILGVSLIVLIIWWFWLYKPKKVSVSNETIIVLVENGTYQPSRIRLKAGQEATISFLRKDTSPCAASVLIPDVEISKDLPLNKIVRIQLPAMEEGEYDFHCQMQMYRGTLLVD